MSESELDSRELFELSRDSFEHNSEFVDFLSSEDNPTSSADFNIVYGIYSTSENRLVEKLEHHGWEIVDSYGVIKEIHNRYSDRRRAEGYLEVNSEQEYFRYYTTQSKTEEVANGIDQFIDEASGVSYAYIPPQSLFELAESAGANSVDRFIAKSPEETFNYYGDYASDRLKQLNRDFGVYPNNIIISTGGLVYRVDTRGRVKLKSGKVDSLFDQIQPALESSLEIKTAHDTAGWTSQDIDEESFSLRISKPAVISFDEGIEYEQVENLQEKFDNESENYTLIDYYAEEGSVFLSGTVYDASSNTSFKIRGDAQKMRVLPTEDQEIQSLYGFIDFVQSEVEMEASVRIQG